MAALLIVRQSSSKTCAKESGASWKLARCRIDAYRRNLQRGYLDLMDEKLNGRAPVTDDQRPFIRGELQALNQMIARALPRTTDRTTRLHLEDVRNEIAKALDPKFIRLPRRADGVRPAGLDSSEGPSSIEPVVCWPEYPRHQFVQLARSCGLAVRRN